MTRDRLPSSLQVFLRLAVLATAAAAAGCGGTESGGGGDPRTEPPADEHGSGKRLSQLLGFATWVDPDDANSESCSQPPDRTVRVTGVVISAIDTYDETGDGARGNFYVQDASDDPPPYSGVTVFDPSFTPPDMRLVSGDVADIFGVYTEFLGPSSYRFGQCKTLPEIGGAMSFRFDGRDPIAPKTIPLAHLKTYQSAAPEAEAYARQWIGMLVRLEDVKLASDGENDDGRYTAAIDVGGGIAQSDVPRIANELFDLEKDGPPLTAGATFKSVTGVLTYFYGFHVSPRSAEDFEL